MEKRPRKFGGKGRGPREKSEFDQKLVEVKRVTRVVAGGKRMRFRALVVIGNKKGKVGMGLRKGMDVSDSVNKAVNQAKKNLVVLPLEGDTIPHEVNIKYKSSKIMLRPAKPGTGVIAGGAVRSVMELAGIKNIVSKMFGSNNKANNVKAVFAAFRILKSKEELRKLRK
ncbi:MAG: 30S ribosomal protein S5 [Candidatus Doudnabacteria bacterium CG10_big_fil_rev_8_21_14_0_10_42_18]|uniref:Small ribosomal subunit protein uS5 n=1 Tax=Candidatus Doudnabacteria bacterium CG10_big_fil_rev_8_21_14_0_10_42_18 TaxID=1974552 RepID=A0A2H0VBJ2_9BACT|nr:MAG: 30S ribosomal protein S5 [Candidatus Doudnabacteria bacterium CG10_big_fil_rev_8_21_14_0_10_42_18]